MRKRFVTTVFWAANVVLVGLAGSGQAQESGGGRGRSGGEPQAAEADKVGERKDGEKAKPKEPVVTRHEVKAAGRTLKYTATAGTLPLRDSKGETEAEIFFIAYTLDDAGEASKRPLMFSFNGGPGSASVWLHLGALGPKRIPLPDDASFAPPPYRLVDNEHTWLDKSDLVFIDPVGTGYSRAAKPDLNKKFHGLRGDIDSVGEFIRMYLTRYERWGSPLYLVGESYGTTRASGLSDHLIDHGVALNGVVLVSSVLNFQTLEFDRGNDLPYVLYLPTYAATAWYHKRVPPETQSQGVGKFLAEVEKYASGPYARALEQGDRLPEGERREVADALARYTGLSREYLENSNLRVELHRFCKELLRDRRRTVGRLDSRYLGIDENAVGERMQGDPSMAAIRAPYTSAFNQYVRADLGYKSDVPYYILGEGVGAWDWGTQGMGFPDTSAALRNAMAKNPYMKIFVASGYYDLATPYAATEYTLSHMSLDPSQRKNVTVEEYEAGHMMYVHTPSLAKLKGDVARFLDNSRGGGGGAAAVAPSDQP